MFQLLMFLYIIMILYLLFITKNRISPLIILLVNVLMFVFGFYSYDSTKNYWLIYLVQMFLFITFAAIPISKYRNKDSDEGIHDFNYFLFYFVLFFFSYHYIVGGIPALSSNVLTDRFNMTSSGLFGIPARVAQFGRFILFFYTAYFYSRRNQIPQYKRYDKYFYISIILNVLYALFSGLKSSFLGVLYLLIYYFCFEKTNFSIKIFFKSKRFLAILAVLLLGGLYFYKMFLKYNNTYSSMDFMDYFIYRLTDMTAEAGYVLLERVESGFSYSKDFIYYIQKYFHITLTNDMVYPLEIRVSNIMNYTTFTTADAYYSPATIGAIPEFLYHFGYFSYLIIPLFGFLFGWFSVKAKKCFNPGKHSFYCLAVVFMITFINNGNLMYSVINYILIVTIFALVMCFGQVMNNSVVYKNYRFKNYNVRKVERI